MNRGRQGPTGSGGEAADAGADAPSEFTLRVEPGTASVTATLGGAPPLPLSFEAFAKGADGSGSRTARSDLTATASRRLAAQYVSPQWTKAVIAPPQ